MPTSVQDGRIAGDTALAPNTGRYFKLVFVDAQHQLHAVFGMEITELIRQEEIAICQRRDSLLVRCSKFATSDVISKHNCPTIPIRSLVFFEVLLPHLHHPTPYRVPRTLRLACIPSNAVEVSYVHGSVSPYHWYFIPPVRWHDCGIGFQAPSEGHEGGELPIS